ncbi:hypothetical protein AAHC03_026984 [Spirometra sp. Aus1]
MLTVRHAKRITGNIDRSCFRAFRNCKASFTADMARKRRFRLLMKTMWRRIRKKPSTEINSNTKRMAVALYDYAATQPSDLNFKLGDLLEVYESGPMQTNWCTARNIITGEAGLIPTNFVTYTEGDSLALASWRNIGRSEAELELLMPGVQSGFFLLRPSTDAASFALSVRCGDESSPDVKHFKINVEPGSRQYYIQPEKTFNSLDDLLRFHQDNSLAGDVFLTRPRPRNVVPPPIAECEVDRSCLNLIEKLGAGHFGEVYRAKMLSVDVAVKTCFKATTREEFLEEAKVMHQLNHPRLVRFIGICCRPETEPIYLITEFMSKGSLKDYLAEADQRCIQYTWLVDIIYQVSTAMAFLEEVEVVHRDLRAANVLVAGDDSVKVADFGLTKFIFSDSNQSVDHLNFPVRWTAPEAMQAGYKPCHKADVWSFGVLMFEVMTFASTPYAALSVAEVLPFLRSGNRLPHPRSLGFTCDDDIYVAMHNCWSLQPEDRPDFKYLEIYLQEYISKKNGFTYN